MVDVLTGDALLALLDSKGQELFALGSGQPENHRLFIEQEAARLIEIRRGEIMDTVAQVNGSGLSWKQSQNFQKMIEKLPHDLHRLLKDGQKTSKPAYNGRAAGLAKKQEN